MSGTVRMFLKRNKRLCLGLVMLALLVLVAAAAPALAPRDPGAI